MTDFDLLLGKKPIGNSKGVAQWGRPCQCCRSKPASAMASVVFRTKYGPKPRILRLCASCLFTGAALKWSGPFYDEECKEVVGRPKVTAVKLLRTITLPSTVMP